MLVVVGDGVGADASSSSASGAKTTMSGEGVPITPVTGPGVGATAGVKVGVDGAKAGGGAGPDVAAIEGVKVGVDRAKVGVGVGPRVATTVAVLEAPLALGTWEKLPKS